MIPTAEDLRAGDLEDARQTGALVTLRVAVQLAEGEQEIPVGPRVVHEVPPEVLLDHLGECNGPEGDTFPRFELALWIEDELVRWPVDVIAIDRSVAEVLLDGNLDRHLAGAGVVA